MRRNLLATAAIIFSLVCALVCGNCDGESGSGDDVQTGSPAQNQDQGNCLYRDGDEKIAADEDPEDYYEQSIEVSLSDGILAVSHLHAARQCGLWLNVTYETSGDAIEITEGDRQDAMTGCSCCFNFEYEIPVDGTAFTLVFYKKSPGSQREEILEREVDFLTQDTYSFSLGDILCM